MESVESIVLNLPPLDPEEEAVRTTVVVSHVPARSSVFIVTFDSSLI